MDRNNPWGPAQPPHNNANPFARGYAAPPGATPHALGQPQVEAIDLYDARYDGALEDSAVVAFTKRVYAYFSVALFVATAACLGGVYAMDHLIATGQAGLVSGFALGTLVVFFGSYLTVIFMRKNHSPLKLGLLYVFAASAGFMTTPLVGAFVHQGMGLTVVAAFAVTAVTFFGLTVYTLTTGRDFRNLGGALFLGLIVLLCLVLLNLFVPFASGMHRLIVVGGILLFIGFILYDTSQVTRAYFISNDAVTAALMLFYDFFALFKYILLLLADRR